MKLWSKKLLRQFDFFLKKAIRLSSKHLKVVLIFFGLTIAFAAIFVPNLKKTVSIEDQLDDSLPSYRELKIHNEIFGGQETLLAFVRPSNLTFFTNREACQILLSMNTVARSLPRLSEFSHLLRVPVAQLKDGAVVYPSALDSPCDGNPQSAFSLKALENSPWNGTLFSKNSTDLPFLFGIPKLDSMGSTGFFDAELVSELFTKISKNISSHIYWIGSPAQQYFGMLALDQSNFLNLLTMAIIWLLLRICLGTWRSGFFYILTLILTTIFVYGGMALAGHPVDPLSVSLFLIVAVSCLEDFIFVSLDRMAARSDSFLAVQWSFKRLVTPSFFTSFTTMIGFGSLMVSPVQSIQHFGFWAMMGCFFEWLLVFFLWPSLASRFHYFRSWTNKDQAFALPLFKSFVSWVPSRFLTVAVLFAFIYPILVRNDFKLSQTPTDLFPKGHAYQSSLEYMTSTRNWVAEASLVFEADVPENFKKAVFENISSAPGVARVETFEKMSQYIAQGAKVDGLRDLVLRQIRSSELGDQYFSSDGDEKYKIYLKTTNTEILNALRARVENQCANHECYLTGEYIAYADYSNQLIRTLFESLFVSMILVAGVLYFLCLAKGSNNFIAITLSSFWSPAVLLCLIQIFQINITLVTCIVASLLVGLTGDNAIQYLFANQKNFDAGIEAKGQGSIFCALIMGLSSLVLLASPFEPPRSLGWILCFGFITALIGDLWLLKGLLFLQQKLRLRFMP